MLFNYNEDYNEYSDSLEIRQFHKIKKILEDHNDDLDVKIMKYAISLSSPSINLLINSIRTNPLYNTNILIVTLISNYTDIMNKMIKIMKTLRSKNYSLTKYENYIIKVNRDITIAINKELLDFNMPQKYNSVRYHLSLPHSARKTKLGNSRRMSKINSKSRSRSFTNINIHSNSKKKTTYDKWLLEKISKHSCFKDTKFVFIPDEFFNNFDKLYDNVKLFQSNLEIFLTQCQTPQFARLSNKDKIALTLDSHTIWKIIFEDLEKHAYVELFSSYIKKMVDKSNMEATRDAQKYSNLMSESQNLVEKTRSQSIKANKETQKKIAQSAQIGKMLSRKIGYMGASANNETNNTNEQGQQTLNDEGNIMLAHGRTLYGRTLNGRTQHEEQV